MTPTQPTTVREVRYDLDPEPRRALDYESWAQLVKLSARWCRQSGAVYTRSLSRLYVRSWGPYGGFRWTR